MYYIETSDFKQPQPVKIRIKKIKNPITLSFNLRYVEAVRPIQ